MQDKIMDIVFDKDDITWKSLIFDLIRKENMNPWDIDISLLSKRFLETLKELKEMDFRYSGKIVLAAAILLGLKSNRLVGEDISELDRLLATKEESADEFYDELEAMADEEEPQQKDDFELKVRTPQPRKRKVTVYDLVEALQKALEVKNRRKPFKPADIEMVAPEKEVDISVVIDGVMKSIKEHFTKNSADKMNYNQLIDFSDKDAKVATFVPLLHLTNQRMINLEQDAHLSDIFIKINGNG